MLAVLESAVEDFEKYVLARNPRGKLFHAEEWFLEKNSEKLFFPLRISVKPSSSIPNTHVKA